MRLFSEILFEAVKGGLAKVPMGVDLKDVAGDDYSRAKDLPDLSDHDKEFWADYINLLDSWLSGSGDSEFLYRHRDRVPKKYRKGGKLYRGLSFYDVSYRELWQIVRTGKLKPQDASADSASSWSRDMNDAAEFATANGPIGFVIEARIPDRHVILDVAAFVQARDTVLIGAASTEDWFDEIDFALREAEVMISGSRGAVPVNDKTVKFVTNSAGGGWPQLVRQVEREMKRSGVKV